MVLHVCLLCFGAQLGMSWNPAWDVGIPGEFLDAIQRSKKSFSQIPCRACQIREAGGVLCSSRGNPQIISAASGMELFWLDGCLGKSEERVAWAYRVSVHHSLSDFCKRHSKSGSLEWAWAFKVINISNQLKHKIFWKPNAKICCKYGLWPQLPTFFRRSSHFRLDSTLELFRLSCPVFCRPPADGGTSVIMRSCPLKRLFSHWKVWAS